MHARPKYVPGGKSASVRRNVRNWMGSLFLVAFGFFAPFALAFAQEKRPRKP